jgi:hypothetical protein
MLFQVEEQMQSLHESYNWKPEEEENKESGVTSKEIADAKWQSMLERFLAMQDLGNNYINSSNMVRHYYTVREIVRTQLLQMLLFMQQFWQPDICQF